MSSAHVIPPLSSSTSTAEPNALLADIDTLPVEAQELDHSEPAFPHEQQAMDIDEANNTVECEVRDMGVGPDVPYIVLRGGREHQNTEYREIGKIWQCSLKVDSALISNTGIQTSDVE